MKDSKDLKTGLVIVTGFLALSYIFKAPVLAHIAFGLALIFLISETLSKGILWFWEKLAHVLGWINTRILLGLVFFLFLFPIATLFKLFSKDPMGLKWKAGTSAFTERNHLFVKADLENPW